MKTPLDTILQQIDEERLLEETLVRLNARVMGLTVGGLFASGLFFGTLVLLLRGGADMGQHLNLLGNFFPLYEVSWTGLPLAVFYGGISGFLAGYAISRLYNVVAGHWAWARTKD